MSINSDEINYINDWFKEHRITEVECLVPDMTGNARGKIIPADKFCKEQGMRLPEMLFIQTVTGDWPDDESMVDPREIDMVLHPDSRTLRKVPWAADPTAQIIHDCYLRDGAPVDIAPRSVLRGVLDEYARRGWRPVVAPELEFYLVQRNTDPDYPLEPPIGRSGRPERARQSYGIDAVNEFDPLFEDIYDYCEAQQLDIDTLIHESGAAQMEINFLHGDAMELADQVFLFKRTVREAAMRHNMYATFMAKPFEDEPGSAMHIHQSIVDTGTGENLFANADGGLSELFLHYIGGLQAYLPATMSLFAPNVNSYRRIAGGESAPINADWGTDNRTVGLRVPFASAPGRRVENRVVGADANPYLALAATLACGLLGIIEDIDPRPEQRGSAYDQPFGLPRSLEDALQNLEQAPAELHDLLGRRFVRAYAAIKRKEYETFFRVISSWEREFLLLAV
ncbi:glutamine synthetase family protein [Acidihalobacter ferrooxydans]|uniref:Glutamine synthetase n=1 Tax=Acidihalobacter ferrooxydans TaxID=1765967 RepID=A0A1P8UD46_9GAMM|nr:glutamine synthetase family protein [Acidihalobacter ferrooxydans]APZ41787.1 glutamine synthetase [Acidihalobacter ferrooxydans]